MKLKSLQIQFYLFSDNLGFEELTMQSLYHSHSFDSHVFQKTLKGKSIVYSNGVWYGV